jgi:purine-binding chemotaxis protein CheW
MAPRTLLVFQVGRQACALPIEDVEELVPLPLLVQPPGLPSVLEGFFDLRGTAVPVLRLDRLFELPPQPPGLYTPLVVVRGDPGPLALMVDAADAVVAVPAEEFLPVREKNCFNDCAEAEVMAGGRLTHLLCRERLLLEKERRCLEEFRVRAQEYLAEWEARTV